MTARAAPPAPYQAHPRRSALDASIAPPVRCRMPHFPGTQSHRDWFVSQFRESRPPRIFRESGSLGRPLPESARAEPWPRKPGSRFPAKLKTYRNRPKSPATGVGNIVKSPTDVKAQASVEKHFLSEFPRPRSPNPCPDLAPVVHQCDLPRSKKIGHRGGGFLLRIRIGTDC